MPPHPNPLHRTFLVLGLALSALLAITQTAGAALPVEVYFSPKGGCTDAIVREINTAKQIIRVQAYSFTSGPIAKALLDAKKRGLQIHVIVDRSQAGKGSKGGKSSTRYNPSMMLDRAGIQVVVDEEHAIAHNKIIILDDEVVITGSFNFSKAAEEENAENLLVIRDRALAAKYTANSEKHLRHSRPY